MFAWFQVQPHMIIEKRKGGGYLGIKIRNGLDSMASHSPPIVATAVSKTV